ncbi:hypothetical protein R1sor_015044 [Riccia sorocarpa]|uniref:Uncharacterized protein n=1 Tax=Riccia sorocarpa TaxID=122646 RepID=A0ABD3HEC6_9MARC
MLGVVAWEVSRSSNCEGSWSRISKAQIHGCPDTAISLKLYGKMEVSEAELDAILPSERWIWSVGGRSLAYTNVGSCSREMSVEEELD